jgi:hypothetical protein
LERVTAELGASFLEVMGDDPSKPDSGAAGQD